MKRRDQDWPSPFPDGMPGDQTLALVFLRVYFVL